MYTLPNRKAFADSITRLFRQYRKPLDQEDEDADLCAKRQGGIELLPYQKLVRDYLLAETPYRGLLVQHGLGSGKTCTAIAVAESLLSTRKIQVLAPRSLIGNFESQISECGDPIYRKSQQWESKAIGSAEDRAFAKGLGISDAYLDKNGRFFTTVPGRPSNFDTLDTKTQKEILTQIEDVIQQRFTFIAQNGITKDNIDKLFPEETMFNDSVVIIEEAHNLIGTVAKEGSVLKDRVYKMIQNAKNAKVVCLSGTPVINRPTEVAYLMNLLRGPIERVIIPTKEVVSWDEGLMTTFFRKLPDVDLIEYDSVKRHIFLTRNPPQFESQYNEKGERIAVKYNKDLEQEPDIVKWVESWRAEFQKANGNLQLAEAENITKEELQCLPTDPEEFINTFIDGLSIKNALMFQRRVQGLVSYYKGADERMLAKRIDEAETLVKVEMSPMQFNRQLEARWKEIQQESRKGRPKSNLEEDFSSYRAVSRMVCNYAIPKEYKETSKDVQDETDADESLPILDQLRNKASQFLSLDGLKEYSPKMLKIQETLKASLGEAPYRKQLVYSNQERLEGVGLFGAILENNGFQRYKIIKQNGVWIEDPELKPGVPAYAMFTGQVSEEERDLVRQIFNERPEQNFPPSLKDSIKEPGRLCIFMITRAGAEGINLMNVRHVHIMESHWNPALIDQAIGRAIRLCSHAKLPEDQRTVKVNQYMTVFNKDQLTTAEGNNIIPIRRQDMVLKRQEGEQPVSVFMSSDEFLQEIAYEKGRISKNISHLLKQAAIDCEIHRKLHAKEKPIIQCMRFDTTVGPEDLAFQPSFKRDERDVQQLRNITRRKRRIQKVVIKGEVMLLDPDTNEIFDALAFEDNNRLLRIGTRTAPGEIRFFT